MPTVITRDAGAASELRTPAKGVSEPARLMTIGEVARRSGFTIKALRFYERRGLLPPSGRSAGKYRLYCEVDLHRLEFIRSAKALGLALDAIRELVVAAREQPRGMTRPRLLRVLRERITQIGQQISMLTHLQKELVRRRRAVSQALRPASSARGYCTCLHEQGRVRGRWKNNSPRIR